MNTTTSSAWNRTPVGIVRVEKELSSRLHHEAFVVEAYGFKKVNSTPQSSSKVNSKQERNSSLPINKAHHFLLSARILSKRQRIIRTMGYLVSIFYGLNSQLDKTLDKIIYYIYRYLKKFNFSFKNKIDKIQKPNSLNSLIPSPLTSKLNAPFSEGDIVFTCGLDWDNSILEKLHILKKGTNFKIVTVIYDLIPITKPEFIQNTRYANRLLGHFTLLAQLSDLVLVNTRATAMEFERFCSKLELKTPDVRLVPWGTGFDFMGESKEVLELLPLNKDKGFFLAVGTIEVRKNYQLLVNIIRLAKERKVQIPHFVFVGSPGWGTHELRIQIENDELLQNSITWLRNTSDEYLMWLYQNCLGFLSPSFSEGFGLPVAEVQYFNKQTFLSDIPVYRELFPNSTFISPNDPAAWLSALSQENQLKTISNPVHSWEEASRILAETIGNFFGTVI